MPVTIFFLKLLDVNSVDEHGQTLLHEIARDWNIDIAQFLFQHGIMIDVADNYGRTPLMVAASSNNVEMMTWLINHGGLNPTFIKLIHIE